MVTSELKKKKKACNYVFNRHWSRWSDVWQSFIQIPTQESFPLVFSTCQGDHPCLHPFPYSLLGIFWKFVSSHIWTQLWGRPSFKTYFPWANMMVANQDDTIQNFSPYQLSPPCKLSWQNQAQYASLTRWLLASEWSISGYSVSIFLEFPQSNFISLGAKKHFP